MRVIAGSARRTLLSAPPGSLTRPTSDRAKEALFNILGTQITSASFLDIFCGSGAIGIEALSRGAREVVFVDNSPAAVQAVRANLTKTRLTGEVLLCSAEKAIIRLEGRRFDIIFLDPPYGLGILAHIQEAAAGLLAPGGIMAAESALREQVIPPHGFTLIDSRKYGQTKISFMKESAL